MSFFRGRRISSDKVNAQFGWYCGFGIGGALTLTLLTLTFDMVVSDPTSMMFKYRPGRTCIFCLFYFNVCFLSKLSLYLGSDAVKFF